MAPTTSLSQDKQLVNIWCFPPAHTQILRKWVSHWSSRVFLRVPAGASFWRKPSKWGGWWGLAWHQCRHSAQWRGARHPQGMPKACPQSLMGRCVHRYLMRALGSIAKCSFPPRCATSRWEELSASFSMCTAILHNSDTEGLYNCMRSPCSPESLSVTLFGLYIFYYVWLLVRVRWKLFPDYNKGTSSIIIVVRSLTILK